MHLLIHLSIYVFSFGGRDGAKKDYPLVLSGLPITPQMKYPEVSPAEGTYGELWDFHCLHWLQVTASSIWAIRIPKRKPDGLPFPTIFQG